MDKAIAADKPLPLKAKRIKTCNSIFGQLPRTFDLAVVRNLLPCIPNIGTELSKAVGMGRKLDG